MLIKSIDLWLNISNKIITNFEESTLLNQEQFIFYK